MSLRHLGEEELSRLLCLNLQIFKVRLTFAKVFMDKPLLNAQFVFVCFFAVKYVIIQLGFVSMIFQ